MSDIETNFKEPRRRKPSKMTRDARELRETRRALLERSQGRCEAYFSELCTGVGTEVHHRKQRSAGGDNSLANCLFACLHCHAKIHAAPADAVAAGFLVPSWA